MIEREADGASTLLLGLPCGRDECLRIEGDGEAGDSISGWEGAQAPTAVELPPSAGSLARHGISSENLQALPSAAGVYIFHSDSAWPLCIGKSVNIRSRVLSHLRVPAEARMLAQARRVTWTRTAGEIGALLLESRLIKSQQPLYNKQLRRSRGLCSWKFDFSDVATSASPTLVYSRDVDFATTNCLYGLYTSATAAKAYLIGVAQEHQLCLGALGLEAIGKRGCFGLQLGRCMGACVGRESAASHAHRVFLALQRSQVHSWPFPGAVGLVERDGAWVQTHVVRNWRHERTLEASVPRAALRRKGDMAFDLDAYRILARPLLEPGCELIHFAD